MSQTLHLKHNNLSTNLQNQVLLVLNKLKQLSCLTMSQTLHLKHNNLSTNLQNHVLLVLNKLKQLSCLTILSQC